MPVTRRTTPDARDAGPIDGDGDSIARCDRGAVEVHTPGAAGFTVDTTADT
jgi:hypothetical protein